MVTIDMGYDIIQSPKANQGMAMYLLILMRM